MAGTTTRGRVLPVSEAQRKRAAAGARPTRSDDTVVIEGGRRATLAEVEALIARDLDRRATAAATATDG